MDTSPSTGHGIKGSSWYNDAWSDDAWHCSRRMHDAARTSLHSVRRGRREVKGSALASAFLFLAGDASLSASAARAPCKAARPLRASPPLLGITNAPAQTLPILLTESSIGSQGGRHGKAVSDARAEGLPLQAPVEPWLLGRARSAAALLAALSSALS